MEMSFFWMADKYLMIIYFELCIMLVHSAWPHWCFKSYFVFLRMGYWECSYSFITYARFLVQSIILTTCAPFFYLIINC